MEKLGIQLALLAIFTGISFSDYAKFISTSSDSSGFVLVKKANGIELYEKWYAITNSRMAREVKVVYSINAPLASAMSLIESEAHATKWNKSSCLYKIIPNDETSWISYIQYDLPWPMENQECVLQYTASSITASHIVIDFKSIEHEIFPNSTQVTRITDIKGRWILKKTTTGTSVEYSITTMPSPTLPRWVTDPLVRNNLIDSMDEFRNILEASKK